MFRHRDGLKRRFSRRENMPDGIFPYPSEITWDLTYECNLRCKHCATSSGVAKSGELDTDGAKTVVDTLAAIRARFLLLSGGEPLLRPDVVELLRYMSEKGIKPAVVSNGVDIPVKTLKALKRYGVQNVQISIDGIGKAHDDSRGMAGAFDKACLTISRLKKLGIPVSIGTAVTAKNIDRLDEVIDLAIGLGCHELRAIPFMPAGRGRANEESLKLTKDDSHYLSLYLASKRRALEGVFDVSIDTCFREILKPPPRRSPDDGPMGCAAGRDNVCIAADGTVYPCTYLMDMRAGSLLENSFEDIWLNSPVFWQFRSLHKAVMMEPCKSCRYAPEKCNGGCRASAYLEYGDMAAPDPLCFKYLDGA